MVKDVGSLPEYRDSALELAEDILKTAEGLAERSWELTDPKLLTESEAAVALHKRVAGPRPRHRLLDRSKVGPKMTKARDSIEKARTLAAALAAMDKAIKAEKPAEAYAARAALIRRYPDLLGTKDVVPARLILANDLIRKAVVFDASGRPGENRSSPRLARAADLAGPPPRPRQGSRPRPGRTRRLRPGRRDRLRLRRRHRSPEVAGGRRPVLPVPSDGDPGRSAGRPGLRLRADELVRLDGRTGLSAGGSTWAGRSSRPR